MVLIVFLCVLKRCEALRVPLAGSRGPPAVLGGWGFVPFPGSSGVPAAFLLPFLSWGCCRVFFFCCLPFSFSSLLCRVVSAFRGVSPRLVCVLSLCPCLGLRFCGSAGVSRWSVVSGSCVGVGCLSPRRSCFWCAGVPWRPFGLVFLAVVLRGGSGFFACSCGLAPALLSCLAPAAFGWRGLLFGCPRGVSVLLPCRAASWVVVRPCNGARSSASSLNALERSLTCLTQTHKSPSFQPLLASCLSPILWALGSLCRRRPSCLKRVAWL